MFCTLLNWFMGRQGRHGWLDFGFQYALIRNNQSKKFGVEYRVMPQICRGKPLAIWEE